MKIKTSELTGKPLDYAVAKAEGGDAFAFDGITWGFELHGVLKVLAKGWAPSMRYCPSTDWSQAGPIIEREGCFPRLERKGLYIANVFNGVAYVRSEFGPTPLIAAMRCLVASKLGDEVDIPKELL